MHLSVDREAFRWLWVVGLRACGFLGLQLLVPYSSLGLYESAGWAAGGARVDGETHNTN